MRPMSAFQQPSNYIRHRSEWPESALLSNSTHRTEGLGWARSGPLPHRTRLSLRFSQLVCQVCGPNSRLCFDTSRSGSVIDVDRSSRPLGANWTHSEAVSNTGQAYTFCSSHDN